MALSDHEQQLLDQLEQQLREDPSFTRSISEDQPVGPGDGLSATRVVIGVVGVVIGLAIVLGAIWSGIWPLGVLGFAVMVGGGFWALSSGRAPKTDAPSSRPTGSPGPSTAQNRKPSGFMDRMEDRWDKRRGGQ
ncbi:DUF3040 domain-containing protein [Brevibacterium jeotgali]|uniref:DUF3040 domain-containing protein n=1 Tax=Brevibacterium jeotgali TaxID=1262550 RepID=A0A2H1L736_9MICO|nr:DUF3040 domain-containing protein [Brevibacterium jeotgali]TWC02640.1 DUF3040 family protein [Brevibacterium jeotgali]SMY12550.1 Protein of unknown function (DUF3040) [Brevibacterium jeotgali]